jgi:hypothetical protein
VLFILIHEDCGRDNDNQLHQVEKDAELLTRDQLNPLAKQHTLGD